MDDTNEHRNATEDELNAVTTAGLTVAQWAFVGDLVFSAMQSTVAFDTGRASASEIETYMNRRRDLANAVMDAASRAVRDGLPVDTIEHQTVQEDIDNPAPWFSAPIGRMIVVDNTGAVTAMTNETEFSPETFNGAITEANDAVRKSRTRHLN